MSQFPEPEHDTLERRVGFEEWKAHIDTRLDAHDKLLREILAAFNASKFGAHIIAWLAGLGAAVAVMWANFHGLK